MDIIQKLGLNATFFVQLINFVILVFILYKLLYKPLFKTIDERNDKIKKGIELTEKMEVELKKIEELKKSVVKEAQEEAVKVIKNAEAVAEVKTTKMIDDSKKKAELMLQEYEAKLIQDRNKLEKEIDEKVYASIKVVMKKLVNQEAGIDEKFISNVLENKDGK
jgi:F-type H+-transporting ATPase subunit b